MATKKPTIIFVPGAWHRPDAFAEVRGILEAAGYTTVGVSLASVGAKEPLSGFEPDVARIRAAIQSACDADEDVVLFMHSYGSLPACDAVRGLDKVSRRKDGKSGGVTALFFCCAFMLPEGGSLLGMCGGEPMPWWIIEDDRRVVRPDTPKKIFYNDLDDETAKKWIAQLKPLSYKVFSSEVTYAAWRDVPSTYLLCEQDQAILIEWQKGMVEGAKVNVTTETLDCSHSPFLSMPKKVAEAVRRAAGEMV